ncbi:MAG: aspartate aminotransferase family protein [Planctomycetes bacterium]|nr:aspartate aminotransferase family protein [Planctomycetota bacterium]
MKTKDIIKLFDKYVIPNYTRYPVAIVRGKGAYAWDAEGKKYLDMFPGWAVDGLGHCHPKVVKAIRKQAGKLLHVPNTFYMEPQGRLSELISKHSFGGQCFYCNSGAEANEGAIKLARLHSAKGKYKIITMKNSFHGRTLATVAATAQPKYHKGLKLDRLVKDFTYVPYNDLMAVQKAVDAKTCAIMLEPIQGEGGINIADTAYLKGLRKLCNRKKLLLIFDEVQTGMGRTGQYFGYQHSGVVPDIMTLAKALGGGVAMGAMVAKKEVAKDLVPGTHASTFGGNPLVCAAAIAVFDAIESEGLLKHARTMGEYILSRLRDLQETFSIIKEVRGKGLMIGIELTMSGNDIVNECMKRGLLINCTHETVLRFMPPMVVKKTHVDRSVSILAKALYAVVEKQR